MSETLSQQSHDTRSEVADLKAKLAKAEAKLAKEEAWGAHDVTVANEGDVNFEDYLANRPNDGAVRDGEAGFRDSASGTFASEAQYQNGLESEDDYYARVQGDNEATDTNEPDYSTMNLRQLIHAMAKAEKSGDRSTSEEVSTTIQQHIDDQAAKEDWTTEQRDEQMSRTLDTVIKLASETQTSEPTQESPVVEESEAEVDPESPADEELSDEPAVEAEAETPSVSPDLYIDPATVQILTSEASNEAGQTDEESDDEIEATPDTDEDDPAIEVHEDEADASHETVDSRARSWFRRAKDAVNGGLTKLYYTVGWSLNAYAKKEHKDGETDEEYNERMTRNGRRVALGITAVAVAYGAYRLYHGIESGGSGNSGGHAVGHNLPQSGNGTHTTEVSPSDLSSGGDSSSDKAPMPTGGSHAEILQSKGWNIPKGSGGEALMNRLGADKSVWYQHQNEFLNKFPDQAYSMSSGNVGFDDPGRLSKGAIEFWSKYISSK